MFYDIETDRLLLKNISYEDNEFMLEHFADDYVSKYLYDEEPFRNLEEVNELIALYIKPEPRYMHRWILITKEGNKKIGTCGFHRWNTNTGCTDIGYDLQEAYSGKGFMSEALSAIIPFAWNEMKVRQINAHIYVDNENSIKIAERHGFVFSGETEICVFRGKEYLHRIYTLIR
jgi:ribosomal-protein-alanine N-acetyltransferase